VCADACTSNSQCVSGCCAAGTIGSVCGPAAACTTCSNPGAGSCQTAGDLFCGSGCCPSSEPHYCASNNTCYATQLAAATACGESCTGCVAATTASCSPKPAGYCSVAGDLFCGGSACCSPGDPYYCASNNTCYSTAAAAASECGSSCGQCAESCVYATASGTCGAGELNCGGGHCCSTVYPWYCGTTNLCYSTAAGAVAACGPICDACH
jgi:hypothetical protein